MVAKNIDREIKISGKTKSEIAKALGVADSVLSEYTAGRCFPPCLKIRKLCQILECNYEDVLGKVADDEN